MAVNLRGSFIAARAALVPMKAQGYGPHAVHLLDHRPACHQPRPRPLFGDQGRHQRLHPRRGARVLRLRHHRQRRRARQHPDRSASSCIAAPAFIKIDGGRHPARPPRQRRATSPMPSCSSPPTRPATSPARRSSSMAASCCPRATTSGSCRMILTSADGLALRQATADDNAALCRICLRTGDAGRTRPAREDDPALLGLIYAVPYQVLEPELAFVVTAGGEPRGYLSWAHATRRASTPAGDGAGIRRCSGGWRGPRRTDRSGAAATGRDMRSTIRA